MRDQSPSAADAEEAPNLYGLRRFENLEADVKRALLEAGRVRTFAAGQVLFERGTIHTHTFIILQGLVRIYHTAQSGREVTLCYWANGDLAGGPDFFGGAIHVWSGRALRPTRTVAIPGEDLNALALRMPRVALWIAHVAMFKLKWVSLLFQLHGTESVSQRLPHLLVMLSDVYGVEEAGTTVIRHRLSQSDLSTLLGTSRQWTNKAMGELRRRELLRIDDGRIVILDRLGLAERARLQLTSPLMRARSKASLLSTG
jgi:CRP/FNR family cyclic AMP-dependent transcriptional regulator